VSFNSDKSRDLFERLCDEYPNAFCYLLSSEKVGTWIGASPELLLQQQGMICRTVALASTHPSDESSTWNEKELNEHRYVVEAIEDTLEKQACIDIERDGPKEHFAGPVVHLRTDFQATLTKANAWEIVNDLHPTPAVCGTPRNLALQLIETREMHKRELYSGYIGWFEEGNTKLFVNLRCAQLFKEQAYLYVGGGYTIDSIPDLEWDETERKAETLLHLMRSFD
jgi:isochorismate synthase